MTKTREYDVTIKEETKNTFRIIFNNEKSKKFAKKTFVDNPKYNSHENYIELKYGENDELNTILGILLVNNIKISSE